MGVYNSPDIFKEDMSEIFKGFDMVNFYIDVVPVINQYEFLDHLKDPEKVPKKPAEEVFKVNA